MESMQPALRNGRNVWDRVNMPESEFRDRVKELTGKMQEEGLDLLLSYGNGFNDYGNPCYLTNYVIRLPRGALAAVTKEGAVTLFFEGAPRGVPSAKKTTWVEKVIATKDASKACIEFLTENKLNTGKIGLAGLDRLMPHDQLAFIRDNLSAGNLVDAGSLIRDMRAVKSTRELDQVKRASRIVSETFKSLQGISTSESNERSLEANIFKEARCEGAEDVRLLIGRPSEPLWAFRPFEDVNLGSGRVAIYLAAAYERYWSVGIMNFNTSGEILEEAHPDQLTSLYEALSAEIEPGIEISQCYSRSMAAILANRGELLPGHGLGQGIGLSVRETPFLDTDAGGHLLEGMCFSLKFGLRSQDNALYVVGDTFIVTRGGLEIVTR